MRDTAVVIPCYNESNRLDVRAFREFAGKDRRVFFVFVNDGSTDRTQDLLDGLHRDDPESFRLLPLARNAGKAEAVRRGMLEALGFGPAFVGYWDADLATPLEALDELRRVLEGRPAVELVIGSRVRLLGREVVRSPRRHYLGRVFATVASYVLGLSVYDTQCGAKLFRAVPTTWQLFQEPFRTSWIFDVEILARLIRTCHGSPEHGAAMVICEHPLSRWHDVDGSKLKAWDFFHAPLDLLAIYRHYLAGLGAAVKTGADVPRPHLAINRVARGYVTEKSEAKS